MPTFDNIITDTENTFNHTNRWFDSEFHKEKYKILRVWDIEHKPNNIDNTIVRTRKIAIFFNKDQRYIFNRFVGMYRYLYNRTIQFFNNFDPVAKTSFYYKNPLDKTTIVMISFKTSPYNISFLRKALKNNLFESDIEYPSHLLDQAIIEALDTYKKCMGTYNETGKPFILKYKTKKNIRQTINIEKCMISDANNTIFHKYKFNNKYVFQSMSMKEKVNKYDYGDSSITYNTILKKFTLNLTHKRNTVDAATNKVCSIDEGDINFVTVYADNEVAKIGINCKNVIGKISKEIDIIKSRIDKKKYYDKKKGKLYKVNAKRRRNLRKAQQRKEQKIKDKVSELHNQTVNYLTNRYTKIYLPPFKTQEMVQKTTAKISRSLNTLAHYKFKLKMRAKCEERNCKLIEKEEYYTTQTCTRCGNLKPDIGNNRIYNCNRCKIIIERDYVGARNTMLRNNY